MSGLRRRIIKLERSIPTSLEAELRALSDEELEARLAELSGVAVEQVRAWTDEDRQRFQDELLAVRPRSRSASRRRVGPQAARAA